MSERKLVSVRKIAEIKPIEGADLVVHYRVDGWWVVDKVDLYKLGEAVAYFEIDSWVPHDVAPFLSKGKEPREYEGVIGERLRTIKLRGVVSQGLLLPLSTIVDRFVDSKFDEGQELCEVFYEGADLTDIAGVIKWDAPIPAELAGQVEGEFPRYIPKTDQERVQNLDPDTLFVLYPGNRYERTGKLEGTSTTFFKDPDTNGDGICSRNWRLKNNEANAGNTLVKYYNDHKIADKLTRLYEQTGRHFAFQGEMCGPGIQDNYEKLKVHTYFIYYIWDITNQVMLTPAERDAILATLNDETIRTVPVIDSGYTLAELGLNSIEDIIADADGPSMNVDVREGVVYKHLDSDFSFKVISNKYLLKKKQ